MLLAMKVVEPETAYQSECVAAHRPLLEACHTALHQSSWNSIKEKDTFRLTFNTRKINLLTQSLN